MAEIKTTTKDLSYAIVHGDQELQKMILEIQARIRSHAGTVSSLASERLPGEEVYPYNKALYDVAVAVFKRVEDCLGIG